MAHQLFGSFFASAPKPVGAGICAGSLCVWREAVTKECWRVSVFSQLQKSRCRARQQHTCYSSVLPVPASAGGQCLWGDKTRFPGLLSAWRLNSRVPRELWEAGAVETGITDGITTQICGFFSNLQRHHFSFPCFTWSLNGVETREWKALSSLS